MDTPPGVPQVSAGTSSVYADASQPLEIGSIQNGATSPLAGRTLKAEVQWHQRHRRRLARLHGPNGSTVPRCAGKHLHDQRLRVGLGAVMSAWVKVYESTDQTIEQRITGEGENAVVEERVTWHRRTPEKQIANLRPP